MAGASDPPNSPTDVPDELRAGRRREHDSNTPSSAMIVITTTSSVSVNPTILLRHNLLNIFSSSN